MQTARTFKRITRGWLCVFALAAVACQGEEAPPIETTAMKGVRITAPQNGAQVMGSSIEVVLAVEGLEVVPAGTDRADSGHHHIFVDTDLTPVGEPIPADQAGIIHMGDGSGTRLLENLSPGEHRIVAVLGDHVHRRLAVGTDTVTVIVP